MTKQNYLSLFIRLSVCPSIHPAVGLSFLNRWRFPSPNIFLHKKLSISFTTIKLLSFLDLHLSPPSHNKLSFAKNLLSFSCGFFAYIFLQYFFHSFLLVIITFNQISQEKSWLWEILLKRESIFLLSLVALQGSKVAVSLQQLFLQLSSAAEKGQYVLIKEKVLYLKANLRAQSKLIGNKTNVFNCRTTKGRQYHSIILKEWGRRTLLKKLNLRRTKPGESLWSPWSTQDLHLYYSFRRLT